MRKKYYYGLMAGLTVGMAVWGLSENASLQIETIEERQVGIIQNAEPVSADSKTDTLGLYARSAVLMDGDSGRVLYGKEETVPRAMASTTKIMTCILALECGSLEDVCVVTKEAYAQPKVHLGAPEGSRFVLRDLLYSLMLESHNDTAVTIATHIGGSMEGFVDMMNQKARDIGCKDTWFVTPNGLDGVSLTKDGEEVAHHTTASDLARIMKYCTTESDKREEFLSITASPSHSFSDIDGKYSYYCSNHNALLSMMDGVMTGKTGFTGEAGYSYVGAMKNQGRTFIIALLGSGWPPHKTYKWSDAKKLFFYGMEHYQYQDIYETKKLNPIPVKNGVEKTEVVIQENILEGAEKPTLNLLISEEDQVEWSLQVPAELQAPVTKGEIVGNRICRLNGQIVGLYPIYAGDFVEKFDISYCIGRTLWQYLGRNYMTKK